MDVTWRNLYPELITTNDSTPDSAEKEGINEKYMKILSCNNSPVEKRRRVDKYLSYLNKKIKEGDEGVCDCLHDFFFVAHIEQESELLEMANIFRKVFLPGRFRLIDLEIVTWLSGFGYESNWIYSGMYYYYLYRDKSEYLRKQIEIVLPGADSGKIYDQICRELKALFVDVITKKKLSPSLLQYRSVQLCHFAFMKLFNNVHPDVNEEDLYKTMLSELYESIKKKKEIFNHIRSLTEFQTTVLVDKIKPLQKGFSKNPTAVNQELIDRFFDYCISRSEFFQCSFLIDPSHKGDIDRLCGRFAAHPEGLMTILRKKVQDIFLNTLNCSLLRSRLSYARKKIREISASTPAARYKIEEFSSILTSRCLSVNEIKGIVLDWHEISILLFLTFSTDIQNLTPFDPLKQQFNRIHYELLSQLMGGISKREEKYLIKNLASLANEGLALRNFHIAGCLFTVLDHSSVTKVRRLMKLIAPKVKECARIFNPARNFTNYYTAFKNSETPPFPFISLLMKDFTYALEFKKQGDNRLLTDMVEELKMRQIALETAYPHLSNFFPDEYFVKPLLKNKKEWQAMSLDEKAHHCSRLKMTKYRSKSI